MRNIKIHMPMLFTDRVGLFRYFHTQ